MVSLQSLEAELKKMQVANKDSIERFDENLKRLAEKKLKSEVAIYQVIVLFCIFVCFGALLEDSSDDSPCRLVFNSHRRNGSRSDS